MGCAMFMQSHLELQQSKLNLEEHTRSMRHKRLIWDDINQYTNTRNAHKHFEEQKKTRTKKTSNILNENNL